MPCLGDFVSRRLPPEFIAAWDTWLQRSVAASRGALGESWTDVFLTSPMWRFVLAPGACGTEARGVEPDSGAAEIHSARGQPPDDYFVVLMRGAGPAQPTGEDTAQPAGAAPA